MPGPLHAVLAEGQIRRLLSLYCDAVSRHDADAVFELFTPDAQVRIADLPARIGPVQIVGGLRDTLGKFGFLQQSCDTGLIDVDGDGAWARIGVFEVNRAHESDTLNLIFGQYEDEYRMERSGWRFHRRRFSMRLRAVVGEAEITQFPAIVSQFAFAAQSRAS